MSEGLFVYHLRTLHPADPAAEEICSRLKQGDALRVKTAKPRNPRFHALFWALMTKLHENLPDDKRERYPTVELLASWFKVATGHCDSFILEGKGTVYVPKSISFAKCDDVEFSQFFDRCADLISKNFIPGITASQWRTEIASMIGIAA